MNTIKSIALVGNPNCGKTALFNALTGAKQKVANYAGVTVERKSGWLKITKASTTQHIRITDLPGIYSLHPHSLDEEVTARVLQGGYADEGRPDAVVMVLDATHLLRGLRLLMAVRRQGLPIIVVVNFMDIAIKNGQSINIQALSKTLKLPVVECIAIEQQGIETLKHTLSTLDFSHPSVPSYREPTAIMDDDVDDDDLSADHQEAVAVMASIGLLSEEIHPSNAQSHQIDRVLLHPIVGMGILMVLLFAIFQAVFSWAEFPKGLIERGVNGLSALLGAWLPDSILKGILIEGVLAGVGGVLVFLPQILILFFFIIMLEEAGYLPRAALLLDRMMGRVGLTGRAFIPLLSSFACAIPGIMATRTIPDVKSRWITVMLSPLMTCSARLPVYVLLIAAFIPQTTIAGLQLQGVVMFGLYVIGVVSAFVVAWALRLATQSRQQDMLLMELPDYRMPHWRNVLIGLWQRAKVFLRRMGTTILLISVVLWFISNYPKAPENANHPAIEYSFAGQLGKAIAPLFEPIGFNWQISVSLVPGIAAREVMVSALSTIYAVDDNMDEGKKDTVASVEDRLTQVLAHQWGLPTAFSLLAWFVFAPMCFPTIVTVRKELNSAKAAVFMVTYQFALAYAAAFIVYRLTILWR